jgi:hypothetical protein
MQAMKMLHGNRVETAPFNQQVLKHEFGEKPANPLFKSAFYPWIVNSPDELEAVGRLPSSSVGSLLSPTDMD